MLGGTGALKTFRTAIHEDLGFIATMEFSTHERQLRHTRRIVLASTLPHCEAIWHRISSGSAAQDGPEARLRCLLVCILLGD
jgi:hypothetical protein